MRFGTVDIFGDKINKMRKQSYQTELERQDLQTVNDTKFTDTVKPPKFTEDLISLILLVMKISEIR